MSSPGQSFSFDDFTFIKNPAYAGDIPVIIADEDDLATIGNNDTRPGDDATPTPAQVHQTGTLGFLVGADEPASVDFSSMTGTVMDTGLPSQPVTSGGVTLKYFWNDTNNTLYATKAATASDASDLNSAFKIHIDDPATGAYTFTLLQPIDQPLHEASSPQPSTAFEDNIDVSLTYTVTDADGDTATGTVRVSIDDDLPVINALGPTQVDELQTINGTWTLAAGADGVTSVDVTVGATTQTLSLALPTNSVTFSAGLPGTLTVNADLTWSFAANAVTTNQNVTFSLSATDGDGDSTSSAQLTLTVNPVNDAPAGHQQHGRHRRGHARTPSPPPISASPIRTTRRPTPAGRQDHHAAGRRHADARRQRRSTAGQFISVADINAGKLMFTPGAPTRNGSGLRHFTFQVQDDGGTANGGVELDPTPNTLTITVTPVNDAPAGHRTRRSPRNEDTRVHLRPPPISASPIRTIAGQRAGGGRGSPRCRAPARSRSTASPSPPAQFISVADIKPATLAFTPGRQRQRHRLRHLHLPGAGRRRHRQRRRRHSTSRPTR